MWLRGRVVKVTAVILIGMGVSAYCYYRPSSALVQAVVETAEVINDGDAADDAAIWIHPRDPEKSLILGTDKDEGLLVYDLDGRALQTFTNEPQNNVDLRSGFSLGGREVTLVASSANKSERALLYIVNEEALRLEQLSVTIDVDLDATGICMYRSASKGAFHVFVNGQSTRPDAEDDHGWVEQWEVGEGKPGVVTASLVRRFDVGGEAEGCVADDELGWFYVSEEHVGIWRYGAEPSTGEERTLIDSVGLSGKLRYNAEGLALYLQPGGKGYLIASSQGSNDFTVYRREEGNEYVGRFRVGASDEIDAVSHTDGIDVTSTPLGARFPRGLFVAQDDRNEGNQNYKLVSWEDIERELLR